MSEIYVFQTKIVLDTLVCAFSQYCTNKYETETCEVTDSDGKRHKYPELAYRKETISTKKLNKYIGIR